MRKTPMISVKAATGLLDAITAAGAKADEVLRSAGVARATLADCDGYMPCASFARLLQESANLTKNERFGLHFGERFNPKDIGAVTYVILNSPTIEAALGNAERYLHLHNESAKVFHTIEGDRVYFRQILPDFGLTSLRQHNEYSVAVARNIMRIIAGSDWVPLETQFTHEAPRETSEHNRVFRCAVTFGCETNALVVERAFISRQVPSADPRLFPILKQYLEVGLAALPREDEFLSAVRKSLTQSMRDGNTKIGPLAKKLAVSPRVLQRRLEEYGTGFKALLDETRLRFATEYLRDPTHTLTEIAFLLGYSEVSAFNRAFKRWTGSTPREHRRKIRNIQNQ